jgi:hypothetical protein
MPTLPNWLIGENLTLVQVVTLSRAGNGDLTETTPNLTLQGVARRIRLENDPIHEDIRPVASKTVHNVITGEDNTITLTIIPTIGALTRAAQLWTASNYFKVVFARGNEQWTGYFSRGRGVFGVENHGAQDDELTFRQVEVNEVGGSITVAQI